MAFVLTKTFAVLSPDLMAALTTPPFAGIHVFVHSVLTPKPLALTGVAGQSFQLGWHLSGDINDEFRCDAISEMIGPLKNF